MIRVMTECKMTQSALVAPTWPLTVPPSGLHLPVGGRHLDRRAATNGKNLRSVQTRGLGGQRQVWSPEQGGNQPFMSVTSAGLVMSGDGGAWPQQ